MWEGPSLGKYPEHCAAAADGGGGRSDYRDDDEKSDENHNTGIIDNPHPV